MKQSHERIFLRFNRLLYLIEQQSSDGGREVSS